MKLCWNFQLLYPIIRLQYYTFLITILDRTIFTDGFIILFKTRIYLVIILLSILTILLLFE